MNSNPFPSTLVSACAFASRTRPTLAYHVPCMSFCRRDSQTESVSPLQNHNQNQQFEKIIVLITHQIWIQITQSTPVLNAHRLTLTRRAVSAACATRSGFHTTISMNETSTNYVIGFICKMHQKDISANALNNPITCRAYKLYAFRGNILQESDGRTVCLNLQADNNNLHFHISKHKQHQKGSLGLFNPDALRSGHDFVSAGIMISY